MYSVSSQFVTSQFTILTNLLFRIYFLKITNSRSFKKHPSQFAVFPNNDAVNWKEYLINSQIRSCETHICNLRITISRKIPGPKNSEVRGFTVGIYLHIRYILEDEVLIEFRITIFSVHLGFVFRLLVWQQIQFYKWICWTCRPISWLQFCAFKDL